jgi:hypothetical protein
MSVTVVLLSQAQTAVAKQIEWLRQLETLLTCLLLDAAVS